jgi:hypothetical protein
MFGRTEEENNLFEDNVFSLLSENEKTCFKSQFPSASFFFSGVEHAFQTYFDDNFKDEFQSQQAVKISKTIVNFLS